MTPLPHNPLAPHYRLQGESGWHCWPILQMGLWRPSGELPEVTQQPMADLRPETRTPSSQRLPSLTGPVGTTAHS